MPRKNSVGDGGSASQKRALGALPDAVRATKKSSKQVASGTTAEKGAADKDKPTTNGACSSYVKCGPRLSKVLRLQKMTFKKMTLK
jgi:hypothetical protein